ncbi:MAG: sugar phosphate nucleotidyltransferase [Erysipelotrichaceae bacterium]|nr:sugar phosphate nucleotidyltransferase [Erysipelotrichaceae bacterium]
MKETLVILAAGMGSRYGGLKQIDGVGNHNEPIIEFTIFDAIKTGFKKVVLIIRKEHQEAFEESLVKKIRPYIEVEYAYQDINDIPSDVAVPEGRVKPWGTTHALISCRNIIKEDPFVVCNADDFYGRNAFEQVKEFFQQNNNDNDYCMVGYKVENTLSDNGTVTRGYCQKDENGNLSSIKEIMNIKWNDNHDGVLYEEDGEYKAMEMGSPVSMNFWGFKPSIITKLNNVFKNEIAEGIKNNPLKYEALLPNHIGAIVKNKECSVKVLTSNDSWFGVTYKEDKPVVVAKIQSLKDNGTYPDQLF